MNKSLKSEWKKPDLEIIGIDPKDIITISDPGSTPGSPPGSTPGITLPFVSYGGTSVVFLLLEMGIALSVSRGVRKEH